MAQKIEIQLVDDIDSSPASQTVGFSLDGVTYEIDLSDDNATQLREALRPWMAAARRTGGRRQTKVPALGHGSGDNAAIRAWALANGIEVSPRGRISATVREAYARANS